MGKKSDAERRAKLKERRKKVDASSSRTLSTQAKVDAWFAAHDAEPNVIAELLDEQGSSLARVEGGNSDDWVVVVGDEPIAGANDTFLALSMFLVAAVDDRAGGNESYMQFSQWLIEEIEARCEAEDVDWYDFLRSLLPPEKRRLDLPSQCVI